MTLTEQVKIPNDKIKANKAQYDLDRQAAKISALSGGELEKYEYLTGEKLGYKPDVVQKTMFEYSPLGQVFNKGLDVNDKKVGLLKRLKNIGDKSKITEENKDSQLGIKSIGWEKLSQEAKNILEKKKLINYKKLNFKGGNSRDYDFSDNSSLEEFFRKIYFRKLSKEEAEIIQDEFNAVLGTIEDYLAKKHKKNLLINAKKNFDGREMIVNAFKNKMFPIVPDDFPPYDGDIPQRSRSFNTSDKSDFTDDSL